MEYVHKIVLLRTDLLFIWAVFLIFLEFRDIILEKMCIK